MTNPIVYNGFDEALFDIFVTNDVAKLHAGKSTQKVYRAEGDAARIP